MTFLELSLAAMTTTPVLILRTIAGGVSVVSASAGTATATVSILFVAVLGWVVLLRNPAVAVFGVQVTFRMATVTVVVVVFRVSLPVTVSLLPVLVVVRLVLVVTVVVVVVVRLVVMVVVPAVPAVPVVHIVVLGVSVLMLSAMVGLVAASVPGPMPVPLPVPVPMVSVLLLPPRPRPLPTVLRLMHILRLLLHNFWLFVSFL
mmetsp:Transcript_4605/g.6606  ORF Transcript_4605/g.6606 Transcript_4605/m.6606 type:complete len:203 (-) Transcript_4605:909-1517(-)